MYFSTLQKYVSLNTNKIAFFCLKKKIYNVKL